MEDPMVAFGWVKLVWFMTSNASARICQESRSVSFVFLTRVTSRFEKPGPMTEFRPKLPKPRTVPGVVPWLMKSEGF